MIRIVRSCAPAALGAALAALVPAAPAAALDYACNFVEVHCDQAANVLRVVPFRAENEECDRVRGLKNADWLVDVGRHVRAPRSNRSGAGAAKLIRCELGKGHVVTASVRGAPVDAKMQGPCAAVFSAIVTIDEVEPSRRRVVNELNLLQSCLKGGAADRIEFFPVSQKVLIQWSSEPRFGVLERTVLARQSLKQQRSSR